MPPLQPYAQTMADRYASASPEELMAMLHDGMITRVKQARERFEFSQHSLAKSALVRSMRIADVLMDHINHEQGGETAKNLEQLYYYVIAQLAKAMGKNQASEELDNILRVLEPLRNCWAELAKRTTAA